MSEKKEEKQVKVNLAFTSDKLFVYGAIVDAVLGLVWAICAVAESGTSMAAIRAAGFFQGLFFAVLGGLVLYGLAQVLKGK